MPNEPDEQEQEAEPGKKILPLGIAIAIGLLVGGGAGAVVAGPLLAARVLPAVSASAPAEAKPDSSEEEKEAVDSAGEHGKRGGAPVALYLLDNLVLNPAESGGTRFLMVTMAFDLNSEVLSEEMKARDPEIRDVVQRTLGAKTVHELADVTARDSLKAELKSKVSALFHQGAVRQVYFPQFVIQ